MVVIPASEGEMGVLPNHAPMIVLLRGGTIAIHEGGRVTDRLYVSGGFAEITPERCTVLADEAVPTAELSRAEGRAPAERGGGGVQRGRQDGRAGAGFRDGPHAVGPRDDRGRRLIVAAAPRPRADRHTHVTVALLPRGGVAELLRVRDGVGSER